MDAIHFGKLLQEDMIDIQDNWSETTCMFNMLMPLIGCSLNEQTAPNTAPNKEDILKQCRNYA